MEALSFSPETTAHYSCGRGDGANFRSITKPTQPLPFLAITQGTYRPKQFFVLFVYNHRISIVSQFFLVFTTGHTFLLGKPKLPEIGHSEVMPRLSPRSMLWRAQPTYFSGNKCFSFRQFNPQIFGAVRTVVASLDVAEGTTTLIFRKQMFLFLRFNPQTFEVVRSPFALFLYYCITYNQLATPG